MSARQLSKASGEAMVAYKLSRRGWFAVNTNGGVANMPNIDMIALKDNQQVCIQVKSGKEKCRVPLAGQFRRDGKYFNLKTGVKAEFIVSVLLHKDGDAATCYVIPVDVANRIAKSHGQKWINTPKRNGKKRSPNFPIIVYPEEGVKKFREAWELLDACDYRR